MSDRRRHRGAHPRDRELFAQEHWPALQAAVAHLSWLLSRGYAEPSSLKLVGDRFRLTERQRLAVRRAACSDQQRAERRRKRQSLQTLRGERLEVDGFNLLTTIEAALAGGVLLACRDGLLRDMASMHGSYRKVGETRPALERIGAVLSPAAPAEVVWRLDEPVSNSGRLAGVIAAVAAEHGWSWRTEVVGDPDRLLSRSPFCVATADSVILDRCARWCDVATAVVQDVPDAWIIPLDPECGTPP